MNDEELDMLIANAEYEPQQLKDYITNLQHTKEYLGEVLHEKDLELEKLKTKMKEQSLLLIDYQDMEQKLENYKSRVEKAVEYLKSKEDSLFMSFSDDLLDHDELIDKKIGMTLLNILNGKGSDE